jgi:hypothetical protein
VDTLCSSYSLLFFQELRKLIDLDFEHNPLDFENDNKKCAEVMQKFAFVPNLKISPLQEPKKSGLGETSGSTWGTTRSLLAEGGVMSLFNEMSNGTTIRMNKSQEVAPEENKVSRLKTMGEEKENEEHGKDVEAMHQNDQSNRRTKKGTKRSKGEHVPLLREYYSIEDMNKSGLIKAKKDTIQQEVLFRFSSSYITNPSLGCTL